MKFGRLPLYEQTDDFLGDVIICNSCSRTFIQYLFSDPKREREMLALYEAH